jgi:hypothetical protein
LDLPASAVANLLQWVWRDCEARPRARRRVLG